MANLGELDILARYRDWQVFGTLTFAGVEPNLCASRKIVFAHLYRAAKLLRIPFPRLVWALRVERGEKGGRLHYHCLLGGADGKRVTLATCFVLNSLWERLPRAGMARHRLFDRKQAGAVAYVASCLANGDTVGADFYESMKFGSIGSDVTLSNSLGRSVGGRRVVVDIDAPYREGGKKRSRKCIRRSVREWAVYRRNDFDYAAVEARLYLTPARGHPEAVTPN